jgi:16S rRNA (uracil1498-N3)-methyltransferase
MRSAADGAPSFIHVPELPGAGVVLTLDGEEAHYLRRVVRVRPGERVTASDGEGTLADLTVIEAGDTIRAEVRTVRRVARERSLEIWCGAPEGDRADWLVEKLAELGVSTLRLVDCERGRWERAPQRAARWERLAVAALRQSRSAHRLRVHPPESLSAALAGQPGGESAFLADPAGTPFVAGGPGRAGLVRAAVGPSGGFSEAERNTLERNGFVPTRLAATRLRTETAALAIAALVMAGGSGGPSA